MIRTLLIAALLAAAGASLAQGNAGNPVKRTIYQGRDGDSLYYQVVCVNGKTASIALLDKDDAPVETCAQPFGKKRMCRLDWPVHEAAKFSCR